MLWRQPGRPAAHAAGQPRSRAGRIGPARPLLPLLFLLPTPEPALAQIDFPALTGRVVDEAHILSTETERRLARLLEAHEAETTNQVVVVTLPSLQGQSIERFGLELGNHWGIGQAGRDNGVLLIVAPRERKVRIEVGTGLESVLADGLARAIIDNEITPQFRLGQFDTGVNQGAAAILQAIEGRYDAAAPTRPVGQGDSDRLLYVVMGVFMVAFFFAFYSAYKMGAAQASNGGSSVDTTLRRRPRDERHDDDWDWTRNIRVSFGTRSSFGSGSGGRSSFRGGGGSFGGGGASGSW